MSISIYYEAKRSKPLSGSEEDEIKKVIEEYSIDDQIEKKEKKGDGLNWESFCVYSFDFSNNEPSAPDVIFEGATKLPDNSEDAVWLGLQQWCELLTQIRKALRDADWYVHVDDHEIQWDSNMDAFDPTK